MRRRRLKWLLVPVVKATLIIMHDSHEGSHAVCEGFNQYCIKKVECDELYEKNPYFGVKGPDFAGLHEKKIAMTQLWKPDYDHIKEIQDDDFVLFIVRLDLFHWSVSQYFKVVLQNGIDTMLNKTHVDFQDYVDPQFSHQKLEPLDYDIDMFLKVVERNIVSWKNKVTIMTHLEKMKRHFGIISYEQFVEGGPDYLRLILETANITIKCTDGVISHSVHKAHSDKLTDTVKNFNAVLRAFTYAQFPQWGNLAQNFSYAHIA